ncbi:unnamed protein product [Aureobasidium mustum]|uniref:Myb-like domain-containing protein n=1 Tax=Aureobasidium mustum TaxID=2773714 RepID=A0A9N8K3K7_9PEZI|nr:unnamed protein product [Aureobasidium mustum]
MERVQAIIQPEHDKIRKELEDQISKKCCDHCKDDPNLDLVVMQEQHERHADETQEEFRTVRRDQRLMNIKLETYKASVVTLRKRHDDQQTDFKNLRADIQELQNEAEELYEDCVHLVSGWFREEHRRRREDIDETRNEIIGHDKQLIRMQNDVAEYNERVTQAENEVIESRERLNKVAEGCAGHDHHLAEHSQNLAQHHERHSVHDDRHNLHEERLTGHDTQLVANSERLDEHHEQLLKLSERTSAYNDRTAEHDGNWTELSAWKLEMEKRVTEVEKRGNERKKSYDNLKEQHAEQQKLTKRLGDQVDDLHDKLTEACEARDEAAEQNQAYVDLITKERTETSRLEQKVENVLEEQQKMQQDYQKYQARIEATLVEKSRADYVMFQAQAQKIEALESQKYTLVSLVEQLQTRLAHFKHIPMWTKSIEQEIRLFQRQLDQDFRLSQSQPVQAPNLEARVRTLEQQSIKHDGLKDWQARMEVYFHGTRDTMFTWARAELKEHQSSLVSQIESLKAQSDCQENYVKMMNKRLEDQDLKFLTLRALLLNKANRPSIHIASPSSEKVIEGRPEDNATWNSSPTVMMADADVDQQAEEDEMPQALNKTFAGSDEEDCTAQPAIDIEQSRPDPSSVLYDPCSRHVFGRSSPAVEEPAQTPSSPLSSIRFDVIGEAGENAESDQEYAMSEMSVHEEDGQSEEEEDSANESDEDNDNPVHAHTSIRIRKDSWSEREIQIVRDLMHEHEDRDTPMAERYGLCVRRLSEEGFKRSLNSCKQLWCIKLAPNRRRSQYWSERELQIVRDTMREFGDRSTTMSTPMKERYLLCKQRLKEQGFERTYRACVMLWRKKFVTGNRLDLENAIPEMLVNEDRSQSDQEEDFPKRSEDEGNESVNVSSVSHGTRWSGKEIEIVLDTMHETETRDMLMPERYILCQQRLAEEGFKRSYHACKAVWQQKLAPVDRRRGPTWSKQEFEILQDTMKELADDSRSYSDRYLICEKRLEEKGFKRSAYACRKRYYKHEEHAWTEHQIRLLGKAFQATGAYIRDCSDQRFKRISEMLNNTGEMAVHITTKTCMEQWKIQDEILKSNGVRPSVHPKERSSMTSVVEDSNLAEKLSADHTEQASYLLGHLTSDYDFGPSQELQKQNSLYIDQSVLRNAEPEADIASVTPISACQGTATSPSRTDTSSNVPTRQSQVVEQSSDDGQKTQVIAEQTMNEQAMNDDSARIAAIHATTESVAEQQKVIDLQTEPTLQDPSQTSVAKVNVEPANSRSYDWMQMHLKPDPPAQGHAADPVPSETPVDRPSGDQGDASESISAADLAAAVADEIAEHCEEATTGWEPMDIGFWIADSN